MRARRRVTFHSTPPVGLTLSVTDHYEGRSYLGFHHHTALVTCAHAFLTEERLRPRVQRPV